MLHGVGGVVGLPALNLLDVVEAEHLKEHLCGNAFTNELTFLVVDSLLIGEESTRWAYVSFSSKVSREMLRDCLVLDFDLLVVVCFPFLVLLAKLFVLLLQSFVGFLFCFAILCWFVVFYFSFGVDGLFFVS